MSNILNRFKYLLYCMSIHSSYPCNLIVCSCENNPTIDYLLKVLRKGFHYDNSRHILFLSYHDEYVANYFKEFIPELKVECIYRHKLNLINEGIPYEIES